MCGITEDVFALRIFSMNCNRNIVDDSLEQGIALSECFILLLAEGDVLQQTADFTLGSGERSIMYPAVCLVAGAQGQFQRRSLCQILLPIEYLAFPLGRNPIKKRLIKHFIRTVAGQVQDIRINGLNETLRIECQPTASGSFK